MSRLAKWGLLVLMFLLLLSHRLIEERLRPSEVPRSTPPAPAADSLESTAETDESDPGLSALPPEEKTWTVRSGDTLEKIALELWGSRQARRPL